MILSQLHFLPSSAKHSQNKSAPNILIMLYDTWSADRFPLHGYQRNTTPFINELAKKAVIFHNHYAGGHWAYPSTISHL